MVEPDAAGQRRGFSRLFTLLLCLLACFYYYHYFFNRAHVELDIAIDQKTHFKLYWAAEKEPFSEKRRAVVSIDPPKTSYSFFLADLGEVARLRIDPMEAAGTALITKLSISQVGFKALTVHLDQLEALHDIVDVSIEPEGLRFESAGDDPHFLFVPSIEKTPVNWLAEVLRYGLICLAVFLVVQACAPLQQDFLYVVFMLSVALVFVISMAAVSERNSHPDEYVHLKATEYYQQHWLPPRIDDPAIVTTYSAYGISRLNNGEIYYLLAGKFSQAVSTFQMNDLFTLRLFNIVLFACILLYAAASIPARLVALPFLLSPQVWYLFSYCGSDAFGLFLCFIAGCELVRPASMLNRLLEPGSARGSLVAFFGISCILALLFLLKINYYPFVGLFYCWVVWKIFRNRPAMDENHTRRRVIARFALVTLLALTLAGVRIGADYYINGHDRQLKLAEMQEKLADHWYKPSTNLHDKHVSMYLKARGAALMEVIDDRQWFMHSINSGFGLYGYFTIAAPEIYYELIRWAFAAVLIYSFLIIGVKGGTDERLLALLSICLAIALIGASLYRSWTVDFQPQGRYLFPILPILGVLLANSRPFFTTRLFTLLVSQVFFLAVYSFVFIALASIPRML